MTLEKTVNRRETMVSKDAIVVGVDDSPHAREALRWAADMARSSGCALLGVHVLP